MENKKNDVTKSVCEDCGRDTSKFSLGKRTNHNYCPACYKQHQRNDLKIVVTPSIQMNESPACSPTADMSKFIPLTDGYISRKICGTTDLMILEKAYQNKDFVSITGETGTGKTHLIRHFCFKKKLPYARVSLNGGTTADELIGRWIPDADGKFKWQDGLLTMFARNGGVIVLDEINSCPAEILFCLHSLTDDERTLNLMDKDSEVIHAHKDFFLVVTMNPDYEGTKPLNEAFKDRFKIKLYFDYDEDIESKLIKNENILKLARKLRIMKNKGEISTPVSTRLLIYYCKNCELFNKKLALEIFLNNFETFEKEPIKNVWEMIESGKDVEQGTEEKSDEGE